MYLGNVCGVCLCVCVCDLGCVCCESVYHVPLPLCLGDMRVCDDSALVFLYVSRVFTPVGLSVSVHVFECLPTCTRVTHASWGEGAWGSAVRAETGQARP